MPLLSEDAHYLSDRGIAFSVAEEGGLTCITISDWALPQGLSVSKTDVLIRLAAGYPDVPPDMWWVDPPVQRADGVEIPGTQSSETHLERTWQRWSRHFNGGQWHPGIDRLNGYLALIDCEFRRAAGSAA